jgi:hypothetical protein
VRDLTAGQISGFENYRIEGRTTRELPVTDRLAARFRDYVRERQDDDLTIAQLDQDLDYARLRLAEEIATATQGTDAATRVLLDHDRKCCARLKYCRKRNDLRRAFELGRLSVKLLSAEPLA